MLLCDDCAKEDWCSFASGPLANAMEEGLDHVGGCHMHSVACGAKFCRVYAEDRRKQCVDGLEFCSVRKRL